MGIGEVVGVGVEPAVESSLGDGRSTFFEPVLIANTATKIITIERGKANFNDQCGFDFFRARIAGNSKSFEACAEIGFNGADSASILESFSPQFLQ